MQVDLSTRLLLAAHKTMRNDEGMRPDYHLFLPPRWRDHPAVRIAGEVRLEGARGAGLALFVERYPYSWMAELDDLPARSKRLEFCSAGDAEMLDALRRVLVDTLDAHDRRNIARHGLERAAALQLESLQWFPSPREWWQLAYTSSRELVGMIVPARNYTNPTIGYVGVVPEQRGQGYINDLLAEMAWRLSSLAPGEEVGADTDFSNFAMARAFTRAGFQTTAEHLVLTDIHGQR